MKAVKNSRGQVAIFIAFIFQVLFLFFAMVVNIGLVVHDKINLQNSVDIAAYYGAQQQAEWMNVIAHTNYQIRQSWKLLTFRYRVLGTMGQVRQGISNTETHPAQPGGRDDESYYSAFQTSPPATCIGYSPTWVVNTTQNNTENLCQDPGLEFPQFPSFSTSFWNPLTIQVSQEVQRIKKQFEDRCEDKAAANWIYAMLIHTSYRFDQGDRRKVIDEIAKNMAQGQDKFLSLDGTPVFQGVQKTLLKNLTYGNWDGASNQPSIETFNSLEGVQPRNWIAPILSSPQMMFVDVSNPSTCASRPKPIFAQSGNPFDLPGNTTYAKEWVGDGIYQLLSHWSQSVEPTTMLEGNGYDHSSLGVEKNPWWMVYYGVKAKAESRQLFLPFGASVTLEAKAYAKPFGGRVGPWYSKTWGADSLQSDPVSDRSQMNDPLLPSRIQPGGITNIITDDLRQYPNYSRFPGDTLGLNSRRALSIFGEGPGNFLASFVNLMQLDYFRNVLIDNSPGNNYLRDPLTWNNELNNKPVVREYEEASVAPDLFDITHYSIQSNFGNTYLPKLKALQQSGKMFGQLAPIRGDLGYKPEVSEGYSVLDQMRMLSGGGGQVPRIKEVSAVNYLVEDFSHLLTSWVSDGANRYPASPQEFATCELPIKNTDSTNRPQLPTQCISGGRSGYSVKLVHENYLTGDMNLGGTGSAQIKNPPENF